MSQDEESASISVVFHRDSVVFSGTYKSESQLEMLASALREALPNLAVVKSAVSYDDQANLKADALQGLLIEIALSTYEGGLLINDTAVVVSGVTDSAVTPAAIKVRASQFLGDRNYVDRVCLVPKEDLPSPTILLSTGEHLPPNDFNKTQRQTQSTFEPPCFNLMKLGSLITHTQNLHWLKTGEINKPPTLAVLEETKPTIENETQELIPKQIDQPTDSSIQIGKIQFNSNSAFLDTSEKSHLQHLAETLSSDIYSDKPIQLEVTVYSIGSQAFSEWVAEKRRNKTMEILTTLNIDPNRMSAVYHRSETSTSDKGEVSIKILNPEL